MNLFTLEMIQKCVLQKTRLTNSDPKKKMTLKQGNSMGMAVVKLFFPLTDIEVFSVTDLEPSFGPQSGGK